MRELFPKYNIGHFINEPGNPTQFEITRFEEMNEPDVDELHKHTFYEIIWVDKGTSKQVIDYREYEITPGMLFFISPGQLHHFEDWRPIKGGSIMFTADFFLLNQVNKDKLFEISFLDNFYSNASIQPGDKCNAEIKATIQQLYNEYKRVNSSQDICQSLLHILLAQVQRSIEEQDTKPSSKKYVTIFKNFKQLLDLHFDSNLTAKQYSEMLHITQHHLNNVNKIVTGKTTTEVIRERSMLEARRLLTFTDFTIAEISAQLSYFDSSYFAKTFKSITGHSPLEFKKLTSEKYRK